MHFCVSSNPLFHIFGPRLRLYGFIQIYIFLHTYGFLLVCLNTESLYEGTCKCRFRYNYMQILCIHKVWINRFVACNVVNCIWIRKTIYNVWLMWLIFVIDLSSLTRNKIMLKKEYLFIEVNDNYAYIINIMDYYYCSKFKSYWVFYICGFESG